MGWDCEHQSIWESECGEWYCLIALTHRFCTHSFEKGVSADVSGQADIRDGVCGDEEVDAVGVWVERRIQLFAERLVHGLRPCCLAHIKLHTGKCILSQDLLDCPTPDPMSITSATINQYFAILLKHQYVSPAIKLHLATWNSRYDSFHAHRTQNSTRFIINPILLSSFSSYRKTNQSPTNRSHLHFWILQFQTSLGLHYHHPSWDGRIPYAQYQSRRWPCRSRIN